MEDGAVPSGVAMPGDGKDVAINYLHDPVAEPVVVLFEGARHRPLGDGLVVSQLQSVPDDLSPFFEVWAGDGC